MCPGRKPSSAVPDMLPKILSLAFAALVLLAGCTPQPAPKPSAVSVLQRLPEEQLPDFSDDMDAVSLLTAAERSMKFFDRVPADRLYSLGEVQVRADLLKSTLQRFLELCRAQRLDRKTIAAAFDVFLIAPPDRPSLVTGYYEPILEARGRRDETFRHPLYGVPPDLLTIDLPSFDPVKFPTGRLIGRLNERKVVPYFTRAQIDGEKALDRWGSELAWLADPVDAFFLHVQGSGMLRMPGGDRRIGYAGANGRPYRSIGKVLIDRGVMTADEMSMQAIRAYLRAHPELMEEILWHNESYVFFQWVKEGPMGSINVPLTAGRSIATDPQLHPYGAPCFLETQKPRLDERGNVVGWEPLHRWVLNQDTGGAIKGPGRVDLFCGTGEQGEWQAGRLKHPGKLMILIRKGGIP